MSGETAVEAIYLERELVRVQFPHCNLVSDHPVIMGGAGRGPSPGEIMMAAITSASVFRAQDEARRLGISATSFVARSGMRADRQGMNGPLHALAYLGRIWRRLEVTGPFEGDDAAIGVGVGVLETLRHGIALEEEVSFDHNARRGAVAWKNETFLDIEHVVDDLADGATMIGEATGRWRANAVLLDGETALVETTGMPIVVSRVSGGRGPTPYELLLGSLASCTAIYVGRNAQFAGIPLDRVSVIVTADCPDDLAEPIGQMGKATRIAGQLTAEEQEKCAFFAEYCALGETLKRGADIVDDVALIAAEGASARSVLSHLGRTAPLPIELQCDDGTCCIPVAPAGAAVPIASGALGT